MLSQQQYQTVVFTAQRANAALTQTLRAQEALGRTVDWNLAACQGLKVKSGYFGLAIADYNSIPAVDIYNQLVDIGSTWMGGITIDPNAQVGGIMIDIIIPFAPLILSKTQADLIEDGVGTGNWYLPYLDNSGNPITNGIVPVSVLTNGISLPASGYDATFTPQRIYGFTGSYSQVIVITCI